MEGKGAGNVILHQDWIVTEFTTAPEAYHINIDTVSRVAVSSTLDESKQRVAGCNITISSIYAQTHKTKFYLYMWIVERII